MSGDDDFLLYKVYHKRRYKMRVGSYILLSLSVKYVRFSEKSVSATVVKGG